MKKIVLFLLVAAAICTQPVMAKNVKVEAVSDFSTANPKSVWEVKIVESFTTKNGYYVPQGTIIRGKIKNVTDPKRLKRNANFDFVVTDCINPETNKDTLVKKNIVGKYSSLTEVTPLKVVETGAIAAGNKLVGAYIGPSVALVKGVTQNEEGNRAKSAVVSVYESTPLSYASKGKELEIKKGQVFVMSFKTKEDDEEAASDKPNYSYTIPDEGVSN